MKAWHVVLASAFLLFSCQKRVTPPPSGPELPGVTQESISPEEPVQKLAWLAARRLETGLRNLHTIPAIIQLGDIRPEINWPDAATTYLRNSLQRQLKNAGIDVSDHSGLILGGNLFSKDSEIVLAFTLSQNGTPLFSDSASVLNDRRLQNTLAQFQQTHVHAELKIPTPLARLREGPLDLVPHCESGVCSLILLYMDRLEILDWSSGQTRTVPIPFLSATRSRSPSGKILPFSDGVLVMHNSLTSPLYFSNDLQSPPGVFTDKPAWLPLPEPARNSFNLQDGHFFDFELLPENRFAVIDAQNRLSLASQGKLLYSNTLVGGTFCATFPIFYASSPSPPGEPDAVLKFSAEEDGSLHLISTHPVQGEILDLACTDLNQDNEHELLITLQKPNGIFIEVHQPF